MITIYLSFFLASAGVFNYRNLARQEYVSVQLLNFFTRKNIELLMNTLYSANRETVRYFDSVLCCRDFSDQNFD